MSAGMAAARLAVTEQSLPCRVSDDPDLWFRPTREAERQAVEACLGCPAREPCLRAAMNDEGSGSRKARHGVWGATTPEDRARLFRTGGLRGRSS